MVYEVLARKWRPQIFQDVIGQEHITQTLINAINTDRLAHAYLFSGARGVGKTSVARILAKAINCTDGKDGNPCNRCSSCVDITGGSSMDVQEIDGASNRGIDEIRELRENIKFMPSSGKFRVYIIDEVHMLTLPAFNALLKTLEEPPSHVKFFFATTEPHKVPVTIISRCQRFDFKRIPLVLIVKHLERISREEGVEISRTGLTIIAREAEGCMRDAQSLLDQVVSFAGSKVEDETITDILGIIDRALIFETSRAIIDGSAERCVEIVEQIYTYGYDIKEFYRVLMDQFRNLIVCLVAPRNDLLDMTGDDREELVRQAESAGLEKLQQALNIIIFREENFRFTSHPRLLLETIMIKLCRLGDVLSFEELIKKIELLEKRISVPSGSYDEVPATKISEPEQIWVEKEENREEKRAEREEGRAEESVETAGEQGWDDLVKFLISRNRAMANVLKEWHLESFTGDIIKISRGSSPFSSSYLDDQERLDRLTGFCREFFNRDIEIKIVADKSSDTSNKAREIDSPGKGKAEEAERRYTGLSPPVQEVLKVFEGEVIGQVPAGEEDKNSSEEHT